jgi:hypothetical protein
MQLKKSNETSPERTNRLEKHDNESPKSQNHRRQGIINRKTYKETQQLVRANVKNFDRDIHVFAEIICEVCSKRCYPNQCAKLN